MRVEKRLAAQSCGALLFLGGLAYAALIHRLPVAAAAVYLTASLLTLLFYGLDKSAAKKGSWRIRERTLHIFALAGGWPGAMVGQGLFHHKTQKRSFRALFWITVILNLSGLGFFLYPDRFQATLDIIEKQVSRLM